MRTRVQSRRGADAELAANSHRSPRRCRPACGWRRRVVGTRRQPLLTIDLARAVTPIPRCSTSFRPTAHNPTAPSSSDSSPSDRWLDVLVEAEQVRRIIGVLEGNEPVIVGAVGLPYPLLALHAEHVDVDPTACKWLRRLRGFAGPLDMLIGLHRVGPLGGDYEVILCLTMGEGSRGLVDPTSRATVIL